MRVSVTAIYRPLFSFSIVLFSFAHKLPLVKVTSPSLYLPRLQSVFYCREEKERDLQR